MQRSAQGHEKLSLRAADLRLRLNFCSMVIRCFRTQPLYEHFCTSGDSRSDLPSSESEPGKVCELNHSVKSDVHIVRLSHLREQILDTARQVLNTFEFIYQRVGNGLVLQWIQCLAGYCAAVIIGLYATSHDEPAIEDYRLLERACSAFIKLQKSCPTSRICTTAYTVLTLLLERHGYSLACVDDSHSAKSSDFTVKHKSTSENTSSDINTALPPNDQILTVACDSPRKRRCMSLQQNTTDSSAHEIRSSQDIGTPSSFHPVADKSALEHGSILQPSNGTMKHKHYVGSGCASQYHSSCGSALYESTADLSCTTHEQSYPACEPVFVSQHSVQPHETLLPPGNHPPLMNLPLFDDRFSIQPSSLTSASTLPPSGHRSLQSTIHMQKTGTQNDEDDQYQLIMSPLIDHRRIAIQPGHLTSSMPPEGRSSVFRVQNDLPDISTCSGTPTDPILSSCGRRPHPLCVHTLDIAGGLGTPQNSPAVDAEIDQQDNAASELYIQTLLGCPGDYRQHHDDINATRQLQHDLQACHFPFEYCSVFAKSYNVGTSGQMRFNINDYDCLSQNQQVPINNSFRIMNWNY